MPLWATRLPTAITAYSHLFARQTGESLDYVALLVAVDGVPKAVADFGDWRQELNVTVPLRERTKWPTTRSPRAERAGAVNTLVLHADGKHHGENTDGLGLVRDLRDNHGAELAGRRILLVGAGGAARGVIEPLLDERPRLLVIANRTADKAVELARHFSTLGHVEGCGLDAIAGQTFDLVINATAASLAGTVPALPDDVVSDPRGVTT